MFYFSISDNGLQYRVHVLGEGARGWELALRQGASLVSYIHNFLLLSDMVHGSF